MPENDFLVDTNILIYHTQGDPQATRFIDKRILLHSFNISILTKIEFLGWDKHTPDGFEKCKRLLEAATVYPVDELVAEKAVEIRRQGKVKLADAVIAATALSHGLQLATKNADDFKQIKGLQVLDPLS
jgi:predicted nucleic acid-binding protein